LLGLFVGEEVKLQYQFEEVDSQLIVNLTGQWHYPDLIALIDDIAKECKQRGVHLVLVEAEETIGPIPEFERFQVGKYIAAVCHGMSIVCITKPQYINKFGENAAVNRGADFLVTGDRMEAENWLLLRRRPRN
jgi:hypothetical protein